MALPSSVDLVIGRPDDRAALLEGGGSGAMQQDQSTSGGGSSSWRVPLWFCVFVLALFAIAIGLAIGGYFLPKQARCHDDDDNNNNAVADTNDSLDHAGNPHDHDACPRVLRLVNKFGSQRQADLYLRSPAGLALTILGPAAFEEVLPQLMAEEKMECRLRNKRNSKQYLYVFSTASIDCTGANLAGSMQNGRQPPPTGFEVWDITDPTDEKFIRFVFSPLNNTGINGFTVFNGKSASFDGTLMAVSAPACRGSIAALGISVPSPPQGLLLYDVTDPADPVLLTPAPFGDQAPFAGPAGNPLCQPANVNHFYLALAGWSHNNKIWLWAQDACDAILAPAGPLEDLFDISIPTVPVLVQEVDHRGPTGLNFRVPVLPVPYDQNNAPNFMLNAQFYENGTSMMAVVEALDNGWITLNVTNPLAWTVVAESVWPQRDWLYRQDRPVGNAGCSRRSPDGKFVVANHNHFGTVDVAAAVSVMNGTSAVVGLSGAPNAAGLTTKLNSSFIEGTGLQLPLSKVGNTWCGPTVYVGYACNNSAPFVKRWELPPLAAIGGEDYIAVVHNGPRNDPNALEANCFFYDRARNVANAGYTAMLLVNDHLGASVPTLDLNRGVNMDLTARGFDNCVFPNMVIGSTGHAVLHSAFNTNVSTQLPYPLLNSSSYTEPLINATGNRVCLNGTVLKTDVGYTHLLNATTLQQLAHYSPIENRFPFWSGDLATRGPQGCPAMHRSANVTAQMYAGIGIRLLKFGGRTTARLDPSSNTFGLQEIARTLHTDEDSGQPPVASLRWVYGPKEQSYLAKLDIRGTVYVYEVPDCLLTAESE